MAVRRIDKATLGKLQNSEHLFSGYSRIPIQEIINCGAVLEVLEKQRSRYMSALEPPHTPRLAGSALHYRALAPVEHSRHDKPTRKEYKGGVREDMVGAPERARRGHSAKSRFVVLSGTSSESCRLVRRSFDNNRRLPVRTQRSRSCGLRDLRLGSFQMLRPHGGETSFCPATSSSSCRSLAGSTELAEVLPHYFHAKTSAPHTIRSTPALSRAESRSPRKSTEITMATTTLSLSIGATFATSPSCKARK
jgi:hypothetical protein